MSLNSDYRIKNKEVKNWYNNLDNKSRDEVTLFSLGHKVNPILPKYSDLDRNRKSRIYIDYFNKFKKR